MKLSKVLELFYGKSYKEYYHLSKVPLLDEEVPSVPHIHQAVFEKINKNMRLFDMNEWSKRASCGTVRCIAGWVVALAGGRNKLRKFNELSIGTLANYIYVASGVKPEEIPNFLEPSRMAALSELKNLSEMEAALEAYQKAVKKLKKARRMRI